MKLTKRDVEVLLRLYDAAPVPALTTALRRVLDDPQASWNELIEAGPFTLVERQSLLDQRQDSLDRLLTELNELRDLGPR